MRKFKFAKLVRDKIPGNMKKNNQQAEVRVMEDEEYLRELRKKVLEEASELVKAPDADLTEEIADLQELLDNLLRVLKTDRKSIRMLQSKKNRERGSFRKRLYVDTVVVSEDSEWLEYYLKSPEKYPEIK